MKTVCFLVLMPVIAAEVYTGTVTSMEIYKYNAQNSYFDRLNENYLVLKTSKRFTQNVPASVLFLAI